MVSDQAVVLPGTAVIVSLGVLFSNSRVSDINNRLSATNGRIDAMQRNLIALIQAESGKLQAGMERIEGVMDARLRHVEEKLGAPKYSPAKRTRDGGDYLRVLRPPGLCRLASTD